jgi:hypothetical protein
VFFKDGKPNLLFKLDENYKMTTVKSGKLLKLSNVPKFFLDLAERRNADDKGIFFHKYDKTAEI